MAGIAENHSLSLLVSAVFVPSPPREGAQVQHWPAFWHGSTKSSLQTLGDQPWWPDAPWMRGLGSLVSSEVPQFTFCRSDYAAIKGKSRSRRDLSLNNSALASFMPSQRGGSVPATARGGLRGVDGAMRG